jgi:hypothetical protein
MDTESSDARVDTAAQPELFVAYAKGADEDWVKGFLLPELGLDPQSVLTPRDFTPGAMLVTELERAVETTKHTLVILSPDFERSHSAAFAELLATHDGLMQDSSRLIPLLLKPYGLPLRLDARVRLDCTEPSRWPGEVARLRDFLHRAAPPAERLPCPYPGLVPFGPEDAARFFGREQETDDILRRIRQQNFLLVVGPSGSGKSSLVSAGVLPRLADDDRWLVQTLRPAAGALAWLAEDELTATVDALLDAVPGAERLVTVLDQAERAFLLPEKEERIRLLALLDRLRRVDRCVVLLIMRADFYADLMTSVLWPLERGERIEIAPLRGPALREAITRPAAIAGAYFEAVLPERLLHDAGDEPGALSLVQETMVLLWERMSRRLLTVSSYEALGGEERSGLAAALATRADAAVSSLSRAQRPIARRIFVRLVRLGEGRQDTRRAQPVSALRVPGEDPALFDSTLQHLTERRLVTLSTDDEEHEAVVDLGHEAMITHWPALGHWIEESRASELARRRIERDSSDWQRAGRDRGDLYRRRKLADALDLAATPEHELSQNATKFLASGRRRRHLALLGVWIIAAAALTGVAWLAKTPIRNAWLQHEAERASPQVPLAAGWAIVGNGRHVRFPVLLMDKHEVSDHQYRFCVQAQVCTAPDEPASDAHFAHGDLNLPVTWVTAYDAAQFCSWIGRRLPTEPQWERAARGLDGARYPWGNTPPRPGQANIIIGNHVPSGLVTVGSAAFSSGDSKDGVEQLIGNVQEWTTTQVGGSAERTWNGRDRVAGLVAVGGSYRNDAASVPNLLFPVAPGTIDTGIGFRCIATA